MANELIYGFLFFISVIFGIIIYLLILNILKFALSFRFIANIIKDFKRTSKKYVGSPEYKSWQPWKYK